MYFSKEVTTWEELEGNILLVFAKKCIRKIIRFFVDPIVSMQNEFNDNTTEAMLEVRSFIYEEKEKNEHLLNEINALKTEIASLKKELKDKQGDRL